MPVQSRPTGLKARAGLTQVEREKQFRAVSISVLSEIVASLSRRAETDNDLLAAQPQRAIASGYSILPFSALTVQAVESASEGIKKSLLEYADHPLPWFLGHKKRLSLKGGTVFSGITIKDKKVIGVQVGHQRRGIIEEVLVHEATHALNAGVDFMVFPFLCPSKNIQWQKFYDEFYAYLSARVFSGRECSFDTVFKMSDAISEVYGIKISSDELDYALRTYPIYIEYLMPGIPALEALEYLGRHRPELVRDFSVTGLHSEKALRPVLPAYDAYKAHQTIDDSEPSELSHKKSVSISTYK